MMMPVRYLVMFGFVRLMMVATVIVWSLWHPEMAVFPLSFSARRVRSGWWSAWQSAAALGSSLVMPGSECCQFYSSAHCSRARASRRMGERPQQTPMKVVT